MTMALFNSNVGKYYLSVISPTLNLQVGDVKGVPLIIDNEDTIKSIVNDCIRISKEDWDSYEMSWDFGVHPLVRLGKVEGSIEQAFQLWKIECRNRYKSIKKLEEELNSIIIEIYHFENEVETYLNDNEITIREANKKYDIKSLISYAIGCIFGRYSNGTIQIISNYLNNDSLTPLYNFYK